MIGEFLKKLADVLWGNWLLFVLLGIGILYTIVTGGIQIRKFPFIIKTIFKDRKSQKKGDNITSFQALCAAIASCVGSGNIVGVSTAILAGGAGALFWMWVAALLGMATKFGEIILGICYRGKDENGAWVGGPMYYIGQALKAPWLGAVVAVLLFIQNAGGTLIQSNTITNVMNEVFHIPNLLAGIILAVVIVVIISGGLKRLIVVAEHITPLMAGIYIAGGLIVILTHISSLPATFALIFESAFSVKAGVGAAAGITMREAMRYGVARGLYSNEAGEGSAAVLHSSAEVDHPVRQGLYGVIEVFVDTIIICSTTGLVILVTGVNATHTNAPTLAASAFGTVFPLFSYVVSISLILFAFTSLMSQWYFGHVSLTYLKSKRGTHIYKMIFPVLIICGSIFTADIVWSLQDCALGLLIIPNVITLIVMAPKVRKLTKEFFEKYNE